MSILLQQEKVWTREMKRCPDCRCLTSSSPEPCPECAAARRRAASKEGQSDE